MLFNSLHFALFLPVVFMLYWWLSQGKLKLQNILLLASSYFFYACWDVRFLGLLIFSTLLDYYTGIKINEAQTNTNKKIWLWISIGINLGFLGVFKYYNFFASSLMSFLNNIGLQANLGSLQVILPVGISFYTFHGLSYVIDIYYDRIKPERNFINYSVFVSFFPLLVAGPIERATHLLPQILKPRQFDYTKAIDGLRQILWGFLKKIVIADNCAALANGIFNNTEPQHGSMWVLGALFFTFQIYCDFSGYSDIALGTARLFGIELLRNFSFPYFSRDIAEFWRRWHISLSSWFKDYLYIPLGGSKGGMWYRVRNTFIIFIVSGFWHGANWTFIIWGILNAIYIMPSIIFNTNRTNMEIVAKGKYWPTFKEAIAMLITFSLTVLAWIFFRATSVSQAIHILQTIASPSIIAPLKFSASAEPFKILILVLLFIMVEWVGREQQFAIAKLGFAWPRWLRWFFYLGLLLVIYFFGNYSESIEFIYFQF
jgi:alginate O-acetyltransferase complex protein AlgI